MKSYRTPRGFKGVPLNQVDRSAPKEPNDFEIVRLTRQPFETETINVKGWNVTYGDLHMEGVLLPHILVDKVVDPPIDETLRGRLSGMAVNRAFENANKPDFALATQLVEFREAGDMLLKFGLAIVKKTKATLRTYCAGRKVVLSDLTPSDWANWWLTYRYGLLPLYLTAAELLKQLEKQREEWLIYDGSAERDSESDGQFTRGYPMGCTAKILEFHRTRARSNARLYGRYKRDQAHLGTGIYDILLASWEAIPLSFVVDWWVGVGDWLGAYRPGDFSIVYSYVTHVWEQTDNYVTAGMEYASKPVYFTSGHIMQKKFAMMRNTNVSPSYVPVWDVEKLKWFRQIDALALSWNKLAAMAAAAIKSEPKRAKKK